MTREDDNPIGAEELAEVVRYIAERYRTEDHELCSLVREVIVQRFRSPIGARCSDNAAVPDGLIIEVYRQVRGVLDGNQLFDEVDEASIESFPASDPPAWINRKPANDR